MNLSYQHKPLDGKRITSSFEIRKHRETDREQCRALWRELTEGHFDKHLAEVGPNQLWVAVQNSKAVGLIRLISKGDETGIEPLIAGRDYRGRGIEKQLIEAVVSEARNKGVKFLNTRPVARNMKAIKWMYRQGFKNLGYIDLFMDLFNRSWKL